MLQAAAWFFSIVIGYFGLWLLAVMADSSDAGLVIVFFICVVASFAITNVLARVITDS